jgi:hypothetical protein
MVRASGLRPPSLGGALTCEACGLRLAGVAGGEFGTHGGDVLVEVGYGGQVTSGDAIQDSLPDFVCQPEGDGRQRDGSLWIWHTTTILTLCGDLALSASERPRRP